MIPKEPFFSDKGGKMKEKSYNRQKVLDYAQKWAYDRNPHYYNFDGVGGDCTSFGHTLVITKIENKLDLNQIFISSHTYDSFNKRISEYNFEKIRFVHIDKVRI